MAVRMTSSIQSHSAALQMCCRYCYCRPLPDCICTTSGRNIVLRYCMHAAYAVVISPKFLLLHSLYHSWLSFRGLYALISPHFFSST